MGLGKACAIAKEEMDRDGTRLLALRRRLEESITSRLDTTQINGHQGFELVLEFKNDDGLRLRIVSNGFVDKTGFYTINYRAPVLYYFDRDYADYAKLVRSFRQSKGAFDPPPEIPGWAKLFT